MWSLTLVNGDATHILVPGKVYTVGRKAGDIVLANDQSVSRKHANLQVKTPTMNGVLVWDESSKFGTFIVRGNESEEKLNAGKKITLQEGELVRFGLQNNIFKLRRELPIVCICNLKTSDINKIKSIVTEVGGKLVEGWSQNTTHLTTYSLSLTCEVMFALIMGKPIVTPPFWQCYKQFIAGSVSVADPAKFMPPLEDKGLLKKESLSLPNSARKTLFKDKIFVFSSSKSFQELKAIVVTAGGQALELAHCKMSVKELCQPHVAVVACTENEQTSLYKKVISYFNEHNYRIIPKEDIGLAIWKVSVAMHCNARHTPKNILRICQSPQDVGSTLVMNTEDASTLLTEREFTDKVIPPTYPNTGTSSNDETCSLNVRATKLFPAVTAGDSSRKRGRDRGSIDNTESKGSVYPMESSSIKQEPENIEDEDIFAEDTIASVGNTTNVDNSEAEYLSGRQEKKLSKCNEENDGFVFPSPPKKRRNTKSLQSNNDDFELPKPPSPKLENTECNEENDGFVFPSPPKKRRNTKSLQNDNDDFDLPKPPSPKPENTDEDDFFGFRDERKPSSTSSRLSKKSNCSMQDVSRDLFEPTQDSNVSVCPSTSSGKRKIESDFDSESPPSKRSSTSAANVFVKPHSKSSTSFIGKKTVPVDMKKELDSTENEANELALNISAKVVITKLTRNSRAQQDKNSTIANSNDSTGKNFKKFRKSWSNAPLRQVITVVPVEGETARNGSISSHDEEDEVVDNPRAPIPAPRRNRNSVVDDDDDEFALPTFSQVE